MKKKDRIPCNYLIQLGELFSRVGFRSPSMADLSKHLGISTKTLYKYVPNKESLIINTLHYFFYQQQLEIDNIINKKTKCFHQLKLLIKLTGNFYHQINFKSQQDLNKYYPKANKEFIQFVETSIIQNFLNVLQKGMNKQEFVNNYNKNLLINLIINQVQLIEYGKEASPTKLSIRNKYEQIIQFYESSLTKK